MTGFFQILRNYGYSPNAIGDDSKRNCADGRGVHTDI
jgi:hypothetical protein